MRRNGLIASRAAFEDVEAKSISSRRSQLAVRFEIDRWMRWNGLTISLAIFHDEDE